jgi:hypothetical protein
MSDIKKLEIDVINAVIFDRGANGFALASLAPEYFTTESGKIGWEAITGIIAGRQELNYLTFSEAISRRGRNLSEFVMSETFGSCESIAR